MKRRITLIALVSSLAVLLAVLLTGCGSAAGTAVPNLSATAAGVGRTGFDSLRQSDTQSTSYLTLDEARQIALTHAGVSAADAWTDRGFDSELGRPVYELEFFVAGREYDYEIDAATGEVLKHSVESEEDRPAAAAPSAPTAPSAPAQSSKSEYIGLDKARSIALQRAGVSAADVRWEESDFDWDDGIPVYELEFRAGGCEYGCEVHALTGTVLDYDVERDD